MKNRFLTDSDFNRLYTIHTEFKDENEVELTVVENKTNLVRAIVLGMPDEAIQEVKFIFNVVQYVNANK